MPQSSLSQDQQTVWRRHVFFIPGFDPNAPRRYRELYRRESAKQAAISGYEIDVARIGDADNFSWSVKGRFAQGSVETVFELLTWEDIVRASMARSVFVTYWVMLRTIWTYVSSGAFLRLWRLRWTPMLVAIYPVLALLLQLCVAIAIAWLIVWGTGLGAASSLLGLGAGAGIAYGVLEFFRRNDRRYYAYYLIHDYGFNASENGRTPKALHDRLEAFANRIAAASKSGVDEVLVIGHSTGAQLAVTATSLYLPKSAPNDAPISLLTLGQVIPMQSFLPNADELRGHLYTLSRSEAVTWVDVSAPGDGACFALTDAVAVSGAASDEQRGPLVISAAYSDSLSKASQDAMRRKYFRQHIQYLCAFDHPNGYDFFALTAGPVTLKQQFEGRASSPSRISTVLSGYKSRT